MVFTVVRMHRSVSRLNVLGLLLVLVGAVRYTIVSRKEKRKRETIPAKKVKVPPRGQEAKRQQVIAGGGKRTGGQSVGVSSAAPLLPTTVGVPIKGGVGDGDVHREKVRRFASVSGL